MGYNFQYNIWTIITVENIILDFGRPIAMVVMAFLELKAYYFLDIFTLGSLLSSKYAQCW